MEKKIKVIGYLRVSTGKQDLERQGLQIKVYCDRKEYELLDILKDEKSGAYSTRKDYQKLLKLDNTNCYLILISELSRLSRGEVMEY